jgi:hypothetical protein
MDATEERIEAFLDDYQAALSVYDAERSASYWGLPGMLISDEFAGALDSREAMAGGLASGYEFYRSLGLDRVEHTLLATDQVSERIARARLVWHFYAGDELIADANYEYLMRMDDDGPHMYVGISIDEMEVLRRAAGKRGVDLPG